jgi:DNA-binding response OmpR family regulator
MKKETAAGEDALSVLVIDEEPSVLALLLDILTENGLRALLARTADEAVSIAARSYVPIDLVVTDVQIPGFTGNEVLERIRAVRPEVRALYMSAFVDGNVIRIELLSEDQGNNIYPGEESRHRSLVGSIRKHCQRPMAERVGSARVQ